MAEQVQPKKYSLFSSAVTQNNQPSGKSNGRDELNIPPPKPVTPETPKATNDLQESFRNDDKLYSGFSRRNDNDIVNTLYNAMLMSAANPYYRNNFGKNDTNGRMNNKTYNATLNMQRLVDRYNNRERLMPGMVTAGRYGVAAGNNEIVKNTPIETADTRQYAQDLEVSAAQREKDLNRADLVASAIPSKFAKSKEMEVLVNQFLTQNEAHINSYMRQLFADTQHRMPTTTMLQEKLLQFGEDYRYYMGGKIYDQAVALSNNSTFMSLWTNIMKGLDSPDQYQMVFGEAQNEMMKTIKQYGANPVEAYLMLSLLDNSVDMSLFRQTKAATAATAKELVTDVGGKKGTQTDSQFAGAKK